VLDAIVQVDYAGAETASLEKFEISPWRGPKRWLTTANDHRVEK